MVNILCSDDLYVHKQTVKMSPWMHKMYVDIEQEHLDCWRQSLVMIFFSTLFSSFMSNCWFLLLLFSKRIISLACISYDLNVCKCTMYCPSILNVLLGFPVRGRATLVFLSLYPCPTKSSCT